MSQRYVLGVDLGGTNMRAVLADDSGQFLRRVEVDTCAEEGLAAVLDRLVGLIDAVRAEGPSPERIGLLAPGPVDTRRGIVSNPPNLPGWAEVPLASIVAERTGIPCVLGNDANIAALGEWVYGSGRGVLNFIYITISTGVGGGIITGGRLVEGAVGAAGEIGHMLLDMNGPVCGCGLRGHLEAYASGTAIARRAAELLSQPGVADTTVIPQYAENGETITAVSVSAAAERGDRLALSILREAGERLGQALVTLVHVFNPEVIAIGGGVSAAGDLVLAPARTIVEEGVLPIFKSDLRIVPAELGDDVGLKGAVVLALGPSAAATGTEVA